MQRTNIEFERQRHLANWLVKSSPHMAAAAAASAAAAPPTAGAISGTGATAIGGVVGGGGGVAAAVAQGAPGNSVAACNGVPPGAHHLVAAGAEARKPKLRRYNSHDTGSNMFSVADFENARLMRRNEIELKQRLARRQRNSANGSYGLGGGSGASGGCNGASNGYSSYNGFCGGLNGSGDYSTGDSKQSKLSSSSSSEEPLPADVFLERHSLPRIVRISYTNKSSNETLQSSSSHGSSTAASSSSSAGAKQQYSNTSSNPDGGTGTGTTSSSSGGSGNHHISSNSAPGHDELFLLYRMVLQRQIYHGYNAKSQASQRKKTVLIPQEFPGYFSLLNEKGLPMATHYGSLMQLVRERVYKFASVDNMPAFSESTPNGAGGAGAGAGAQSPSHEGCLPVKNRPQYVKTTARGGQVFRLLAVFEDGKQESGGNLSGQAQQQAAGKQSHVTSVGLGRDKEKGRYAQLLNEQRQVMYVPLSTKGKFYEIEPGIPQLLQKLGGDAQRKLNPDCVHRLGALVAAAKQLPLMLRYISGPPGVEIPEQLCISHVSKEDVIIGCPIEELPDAAIPPSAPVGPLRKLYLSREMQLTKCLLGFDTEQRMLANSHVQNMLKFCQFNCDQFLKLVEIELMQRAERSGSKTREGLKILKPLHLPKLLRREKSSMAATASTAAAVSASSIPTNSAHEKEDSIIFLSKSDLEQMEQAQAQAQAQAQINDSSTSTSSNRITERMKVFQSTKKKWFRKQSTQLQQQQQQQLEEEQQKETETAEQLQAKRMSMERYTDMSKLLQERFGGNVTQMSTVQSDTQSLHSETETTTLAISMDRSSMPKSLDTLLQKSMSLQDIELLNGQPGQQPGPDLLNGAVAGVGGRDSDAISEEDVENQTPPPQSFITEKLYNEFHVKTRQYSKSSSSLHQLRHFSLPQKLQLHETEREKRSLAQLKAQQQQLMLGKEPITGRRAAGGVSLLGGLVALSPAALLSPTSLVEDDLPYSSVRDSLVMSSLGHGSPDESKHGEHGHNSSHVPDDACADYAKENIYAEICASHTCDTFSGATQLTQLQYNHHHDDDDDDDDGDYASLKYQPNGPQSVSRVEISCTPATSAISYHTVYLGEEALGERHVKNGTAAGAGAGAQHVTTVELAGETNDNIYNTLK